MAIAYTLMYSLALDNGAISNRMTAAVAVAAQTVFQESAGVPNHSARLAWAQKAIADPIAWGKRMVWGVLADPAIGVGATDAQLQTSVDALVNQFLLA